MSVQPVTYYQAVCDSCGYIDDEGDYSAWSDAETAESVALDSDWAKDEKGRLLCVDCNHKSLDDEAPAETVLGPGDVPLEGITL